MLVFGYLRWGSICAITTLLITLLLPCLSLSSPFPHAPGEPLAPRAKRITRQTASNLPMLARIAENRSTTQREESSSARTSDVVASVSRLLVFSRPGYT
jgi:hypothetical protein